MDTFSCTSISLWFSEIVSSPIFLKLFLAFWKHLLMRMSKLNFNTSIERFSLLKYISIHIIISVDMSVHQLSRLVNVSLINSYLTLERCFYLNYRWSISYCNQSIISSFSSIGSSYRRVLAYSSCWSYSGRRFPIQYLWWVERIEFNREDGW